MKFQFVQVCLSHENFFCPATGQCVLGAEGFFDPSPALLFAWIAEASQDPMHVHTKVQPLLEEFREINEDDEEGESYLDYYTEFFDAFTEQSCVLFEISTCGAGGPVWDTVYLLFDLNYQAKDSGDFYMPVESFLNPPSSER